MRSPPRTGWAVRKILRSGPAATRPVARWTLRTRRWIVLLSIITLVGVGVRLSRPNPSPPPPPRSAIGRLVADFQLRDAGGRRIALADFRGKRAVVLVFTGIDCPIGNLYMPRLARLSRSYQPRGVAFMGINANAHETSDQVAAHARSHGVDFPVVKDPIGRVTDQLGVDRTCTALVLDGAGRLRYRGAIDDQYLVRGRKVAPTRNDLAEALEAVLAGREVSVATTTVVGCPIEFERPRLGSGNVARVGAAAPEVVAARNRQVDRTPIVAGRVGYAEIAPILQAKCQPCHRPGQVGPFSLVTHDHARRWAVSIREVVDEYRMPPWHADPRFGRFANDRSLSPRERATLMAWVDQGTPRGDPASPPPPRTFPEGWSIGTPDVIIAMPEPFHVAAEGVVDYQHFRVPTRFLEDRWVQAAEVRPGDRAVVHHIGVYVDDPTAKPGGTDRERRHVLACYFPGDQPSIFPPGIAKRIPAGADLHFEVHYTPIGTPRTDRSDVGLVFAKEPVIHQAVTRGIPNKDFVIPPRVAAFPVRSSYTFPDDVHLLGLMPHMHLRGKDFLYRAVYPDGGSEILLSVPAYDFAWQAAYRLDGPKPLPGGSRIECLAHFDNSADNPANPDPDQAVSWGDQSWEEMMIGYVDYYVDGPIPAAPAVVSARGRNPPR